MAGQLKTPPSPQYGKSARTALGAGQRNHLGVKEPGERRDGNARANTTVGLTNQTTSVSHLANLETPAVAVRPGNSPILHAVTSAPQPAKAMRQRDRPTVKLFVSETSRW
jgi:hypothetical protein